MASIVWISDPNENEERAAVASRRHVVVGYDRDGMPWTFINALKGYYIRPWDRVEEEWRWAISAHKGALEKQDWRSTRYAFYTEILVTDVTLALKDRLEEHITFRFAVIKAMLAWLGEAQYTSHGKLKTLLNLSADLAWWWLKVLCWRILILYDYPLVIKPYEGWGTKAEVLALFPWLVIAWKKIPQEFYDLVVKKTGLEGDELQDEVDRIIFECTSNLRIDLWINEQYRILQERQERRSRLRTYLIIAMMAVVILPTIYLAFKTALSVYSHVAAWQISTLAKFKLALVAFTDVLGAGFSAFLAAIQYDTLVGIHRIAELVSEDYRNVMRGVYGEITKVSSALGYGPYTLLLLTQNSKRLIQDVSSTIGMEWDLAEVQWLSTFQSYMTKFSGAAYRYRDNPEALLYDMGRWVERDAVNAKGAFMASLVQSVDGLLKDVENFVGDIVTIKEDVNKLVMDLPEKISRQIADAIDPYISKFDDFITGTYDPYREILGSIVDSIQAHQAEIRDRTDALIDRLKKPGDYLLEIDAFSDEDRLDQEGKIADLSRRQHRRDVKDFSVLGETTTYELDKLKRALKIALPIPIGFPEEIEAPVRPAGVKAKPRKTWNVGDY